MDGGHQPLTSGWPPPFNLAVPTASYHHNEQSPSALKAEGQASRAIAGNYPATDTLRQYFDNKINLVDSASSTHGRQYSGGADDSSEQMEQMEFAALGRLLPELDGDGEQHPPAQSRAVTAAPASAAAMNTLTAAGKPLRHRVGSTASIEEDVFSSVGGLELGHDPADTADPLLGISSGNPGAAGGLALPSVASLADLTPVESPSRTLFVQNVAPDVLDEDIRRLFAAHGDLRILYTACKQRGLVIVGYFDLRCAMSAAQSLQGAVLGGRRLDVGYSAPRKGETNQVNQGVVVVYNLDPDTNNDQLLWIFSRFGEVKDIQQSPQRSNQKFIEFYDVRHAAAALKAMNKAELSRLPGTVPSHASDSVAAAAAAAAAGMRQARVHSGDGSTPRQPAASSSSSQSLASAQVAAAMQQLELEQQQQSAQVRSQGQPIPRAPSFDPNMGMTLHQQAESLQQVAHRGMVRPVSGMLDRMHAAVSPPLNLGPLSHSWDTTGQPGSLLNMINRQQQQQQSGQGAQQQQQQQAPGAQFLQQQQQQQQLLLQQALASGYFRGSRTDLSGLDAVPENSENGDSLQKLLLSGGPAASSTGAAAAGPAAAAAGRQAPVSSSSMHVSDSASSIASTQGNVFGTAGVSGLAGHHHHQGLHQGFGHSGLSGAAAAAAAGGPQGGGFGGHHQPLGPGAAAAAAAAAAAGGGAGNMQRSFGSSDQLHGMEHLLAQQAGHDDGSSAGAAAAAAAAAGLMLGAGGLGNSMSSNNLAAAAAGLGSAGVGMGLSSGIASASFDSGLNMMADGQHQQAGGLGGFLGSHPYLLNAAEATGGLYPRAGGLGGTGLRSLSHPCLSMSAMAAAAAQAQQQQQQQQQAQQQTAAAAAAAAAVAAGRLLNQQTMAAAMLQAQAAGLNLQELQQQQQQLALQQLLQANLQAQTMAGAVNLQAAQQLLQAGMHPQQLAAAGLLNPAALAGLGLPASSSYGTLHNLGALQSAAAAAAAASAAAAAAGGGIPRGVSSGSLSGMDGRGHRTGDPAGSAGGSRGGGRLSRRAADPAVEAERKAQQEKLFALDVDRILSGEDKRTTLMIKNIPNKYTQKMLLQTIEEQFKGTFDFFYLPIDFKNKCNVGYAFINMLKPEYIPPLVARFNNKRWDKFNSEKICNISYGRIQGRAALISHFQNSSLMHEDKRCRPVLFISEGPDAGEPEPFPMGTHARPRGAGSSGSGGGLGGSSGHLADRSPRVSSSGAMSGGSSSVAGSSLPGSRVNSGSALAAAAAAAAPSGSSEGLSGSGDHLVSVVGLAGGGDAGDAAPASQQPPMQPSKPPGLSA